MPLRFVDDDISGLIVSVPSIERNRASGKAKCNYEATSGGWLSLSKISH